MENVTKALLIAGGVLLAIMILSILVIFRGRLTGYFERQHESKIIEQDTKFNAKFENYNQETIRGNELISIMNKVVDYNTSIVGVKGDYDRIVMSVDFKGYQNSDRNNFKYSAEDESIFRGIFSGNSLNNNGNDTNLKRITDLPATVTSGTGLSEDQLQKLSANIQNIVLSDSATEDAKNTRNKKLQSIIGKSNLSNSELNKLIEVTKKYYQYTQLKRAMFKCTEVNHNTDKAGARVNGITFEIVVENGNVKFD